MSRALAVVVPSRARPDNLARLAEAMRKTCRGDTQLIVGLDDDDAHNYTFRIPYAFPVNAVIRPGLRYVVPWLNEIAVPAARTCRFIGTLGDDNLPTTVGWDVRVCESLERNLFCFGNDLHPGRPPGSLACHVFTRSSVIRALGYLGPPSIRHMYVDNVWTEWGMRTSIEYLHDVVLEHLHPSAQKSQPDPVYQASEALIHEDRDAFARYLRDGLAADLQKLGELT